MNKREQEAVEEMSEFLKEAFCVIGNVEFDSFSTVKGLISTTFRVFDSRRGEFYITLTDA